MADEDSTVPPESGAGDVVHRSVKAVLGAVPFVGGGAAEFFDHLVAPPLRKKHLVWMENMSQAIQNLQGSLDGFDSEKLAENPRFAAAVLVATQAAMKTSDQEKLTALQNALLNVAVQQDANSIEQDLFLYLVDRLTPFHLQVLHALVEYCLRRDELEKMPKAKEFPVLASDLDLAELATMDLYDCHLVYLPRTMFLGEGSTVLFTNKFGDLGTNHLEITDIGRRFLSFISTPRIE